MAWIDTAPAEGTMPQVSTSTSASTYNEDVEEEFVELGVTVYEIKASQRFDVTEITRVYERDGYTLEAAVAWVNEVPATRERTWGSYVINPDVQASWQVSLDYIASEVVTTRSISQSSTAGSYKLTKTIVTQTTVPVPIGG